MKMEAEIEAIHPQIAENHQNLKKSRKPPRVSREGVDLLTPDSGLAHRTVRKYTLAVLSHTVCGDLLQQSQEMNIVVKCLVLKTSKVSAFWKTSILKFSAIF